MMYNYIKKWKGDAKKMLLNFKMENFRSFKDETFFTMLSSKQKTHNDYVIDKSVNGITVCKLRRHRLRHQKPQRVL